MPCMLVTLDVSHFDKSRLKADIPENRLPMSVTPDTSQDSIGPYEPLAQSPFAESLMHATTAALSCALVFGANVVLDGSAVEGTGVYVCAGDLDVACI